MNISEQDLLSRTSGFTESIVSLKPPDTDEPEDDEAQSAGPSLSFDLCHLTCSDMDDGLGNRIVSNTLYLCCLPADLTAFVDQYLFGSDLSPPLTRSGIHTVSLTDAPLSRYVVFCVNADLV